MQIYGGVEAQLHAFFPCALYEVSGYMHAVEKKKIYFPCGKLNLGSSAVQPLASTFYRLSYCGSLFRHILVILCISFDA
jgi:hypothetical protein